MGLAELKVQLQQFASNSYVQGGKEFLNSNSIVAKFAFLILILIVFMLLISLGSLILSLVFRQSHNPILIDGMINSNQMMVIPQDPSKKGAKPIYRSNNEREGLEFTWSVWVFINDDTFSTPGYKHIFHKGNNNINITNNMKYLALLLLMAICRDSKKHSDINEIMKKSGYLNKYKYLVILKY